MTAATCDTILSVQKNRSCSSLVDFPCSWTGAVRTDDPRYTVYAKHTVYSGFFFLIWKAGEKCSLAGLRWWTHSRPVSLSLRRWRSVWTHPAGRELHRARCSVHWRGAQGLLTERQSEICLMFTFQNQQRSTLTMAFSSICHPAHTVYCCDSDHPVTVVSSRWGWW